MFPILTREEVEKALIEGGSVDAAIPGLFKLYEEKSRQDQQTKSQLKIKETTEILQKSFALLDKAVIDEVVTRCGGDMEAAAQEIIKLIKVQEEEDERRLREEMEKEVKVKQEREQQFRDKLIKHCQATFEVLTKEEIVEVLRSVSYDPEKAVAPLRERAEQRKCDNLQHFFPALSSAVIRETLQQCHMDIGMACAALSGAYEPSSASPPRSPRPQDPDRALVMQDILRETVGPGCAPEKPSEKPKELGELDGIANQPAVGTMSVALKLPTRYFRYGDTVNVESVVKDGDASSYDWIGLFDVRSPDNSRPVHWQWYKPLVTLSPPNYGKYEVRYVRKIDGNMQTIATSDSLFVGPVITMSLESKPDEWIVHYKWQETSEPLLSSSWIALYAKGTPDESYLGFAYLKQGQSSVTFKRRTQNGEYEFRFFAYKYAGYGLGDNDKAVVSVKGEDSVTVERNDTELKVTTVLASVDPSKNRSCWVGLFHKNDARSTGYRRYNYISTPTQTFSFKTMIHSGTYEARIYDESKRLLARSEEFVINGI